jgi:hypothetical protein
MGLRKLRDLIVAAALVFCRIIDLPAVHETQLRCSTINFVGKKQINFKSWH